jgi:hypothetical protein
MLALSSGVTTAWWIALGVGLVVALVVWGLLEALRRAVDEVDRGAAAVWTSGKRVAQNTWTAHLFHTTKARGVELLEEVQQHARAAERSGS